VVAQIFSLKRLHRALSRYRLQRHAGPERGRLCAATVESNVVSIADACSRGRDVPETAAGRC
jgi:hypothetical protein